ncbi:MAG TPA: Ig-like domain-containing protein [Candidatus Deferrimicrobiaceae bacterium]
MQSRDAKKQRAGWSAPLLALLLALALAGNVFAGGKPAPVKSLMFESPWTSTQPLGEPFTGSIKVDVTSNGAVNAKDNRTKVTLSLATGTGALSGTLVKTVVAGVATFDGLAYDKAESITLRATASDTAILSATSPPVEVVAPVPTMQVASVVPAAGTTLVAVNATISATFSAPVDPSTVDSGTFAVQKAGGGYLSGSYAFFDNNTRVVFTPAEPLSTNATFTAYLTTGVRGLAGEQLPSTWQWAFTTAPPDWGRTSVPMAPGGQSYGAGLAMGRNGGVVAFWTAVDNASPFFRIRGSRYNPALRDSTGWEPALTLFETTEPMSSGNIPVATGAADGAGNAFILWSEPSGGLRQPVCGEVPLSGATARQAIGAPADRVYPLQISMIPSGVALASWITESADRSAVAFLANRRGADGAWGIPVELSAGGVAGAKVGGAVSAIGDSGVAAAAWVELQPGNAASNPIHVRVTDRLGNWLPAGLPVATNGNGTTMLAVAVAPDDSLILVTSVDNAVSAYRIVSGSPDGPPTLLSRPEGEIVDVNGELRVAVDASGNAVAAWVQHDYMSPPSQRIRTNRYTSGLGWAGTRAFTGPLIGNDTLSLEVQLRLAYDGMGNAFLAWCQKDSFGGNSVFISRSPAGTDFWPAPRQMVVLGPNNQSFYPTLGAGDRGDAFVVWETNVSTFDDIYANRYQPAIP